MRGVGVIWRKASPGAVLLCAALTGVAASWGARAEVPAPLLLRDPTISHDNIAFSYAGDIWVVGRDGHGLRQLTRGGHDRKPRFSPDGSQIAFSTNYVDDAYYEHRSGGIYVVPTNGGLPRRLTYHPSDLAVAGWTPDGTRVIFGSRRAAFDLHQQAVMQLFSIPVAGGFAAAILLPTATEMAPSPDGTRVAYVPNVREQPEWKRYRGGQTTPIWIANLSDSSIEAKIPRDNSNDSNPMWVGDTIYFLSDRDGPVTLYAYDLKTRQVRQLVRNTGFDIKSAAASSDAIVYDQFGSLHQLNLSSGADRVLSVRPSGNFPEVHPRLQRIDPLQISFADLSPAGGEAVFGARGEIFTVTEGSSVVHDVTMTTDAVERDPAWSPEGKYLAYFSDKSGEYALHIRAFSGRGAVREIDLGSPHGFYYAPRWSPDSTKVGYTDQRSNYWYVDLQRSAPVRVDTDVYADLSGDQQMTWSPDSRWIAYTKRLPSHLRAVFLYSLAEAKSYQLTDDQVDASHPVFDRSGRYLYFTASTDVALSTARLELSSLRYPVTQHVYVAVLKKGARSPLAQVKDMEPVKAIGIAGNAKVPAEGIAKLDLDIEGLRQRILELPIPARNYLSLTAGESGVLFLVEGPEIINVLQSAKTLAKVHQFDLDTLRMQQILDNVVAFRTAALTYTPCFYVSFMGNRLLYSRGDQWVIAPADKLAAGTVLNLGSMQVQIDPRAEWKHMYEQVWRHERDFFYDPGLHGLNLEAVRKTYLPFLENIATRDDLNYLFSEMLANMTVGHVVALGGDGTAVRRESIGMLGADYTVENGRYRFARIYGGDPWGQEPHAPLTQPGADVSPGEYLLGVDGRDVEATADVYSFFVNKADQPVLLTVGAASDGSGARQVTVIPVKDETPLRNYAWIEDNRHKVESLSGGRVAYIYLPDVSGAGYARFNRDYFAQVGKGAAVIDARFNFGGFMPDYFIQYLHRPLLSFWHLRYGKDFTEPQQGIFGPKVMIINEMTASGGDALAWMFRQADVGPLVGRRTWGGLVFGGSADDLLDGGFVSAPSRAFYNLSGTWDVENVGVAPDVEVEEDPKGMREGHDRQLEKAVAVALDLLRDRPPPPAPQHPPFVSYYNGRSK
jgi:tricorn protease